MFDQPNENLMKLIQKKKERKREKGRERIMKMIDEI